MATSKIELRQEIETLCAERGVSVPDGLQGMNFVTLQATLEQLKAGGGSPPAPAATPPEGGQPPGLTKVEAPPALDGDVSTEPGGAPPPEVPPEVPPDAPPAPDAGAADGSPPPGPPPSPPAPPTSGPWRYFVAQGRMLSNTLKGKIGAFDLVKAKDLPGGEEALEALFEQGLLTRKP
jgi:hypothetical protein